MKFTIEHGVSKKGNEYYAMFCNGKFVAYLDTKSINAFLFDQGLTKKDIDDTKCDLTFKLGD